MKLWGVRLDSCINESVSHDTLPRSSLLRQNIQVNLGKRRCRDKDEIGAEIWNVLFFPPGARASQMLTGADSSWYEFLFTRYLSTQPFFFKEWNNQPRWFMMTSNVIPGALKILALLGGGAQDACLCFLVKLSFFTAAEVVHKKHIFKNSW